MIGAMPAVAVRHERRRQEKRGGSGSSGHHQVGLCSRPSQLYVGGVWPPPHSPCSTSPSPGGHHSPDDDQFREYYVCGKISALQLVVGSLLLGAIVLVVGLVQLTPGADAADHRFYLMGAGTSLIALGLALTAVRCCCMHCPRKSSQVMVEQPQGVSSIDMLVKDGVITSPSELDVLIKNHNNTHENHNHNNHNHNHHDHHQHQHQHQHQHHQHNHRGSNGHVVTSQHNHHTNVEVGSTSSEA